MDYIGAVFFTIVADFGVGGSGVAYQAYVKAQVGAHAHRGGNAVVGGETRHHQVGDAVGFEARGEVVGLALCSRNLDNAHALASFGSLTELYLMNNELSDVAP